MIVLHACLNWHSDTYVYGTLAGETDYKGPNIHLVGATFLPRAMSIAFDFYLMVTASLVLISNILAGGQAWAHLLSIS